MKRKIAVFTAIMVTLALFFSFSAIGQDAAIYEDLLDQYVNQCASKTELKSSGLINVRKAAAVAMLKGTFAKAYRTELIKGMVQGNLEPKPYKVKLFINDQFYNVFQPKEEML